MRTETRLFTILGTAAVLLCFCMEIPAAAATRQIVSLDGRRQIADGKDYFWYRKTFLAARERSVALLKINKAQFGTAVWLNDEKLGEYPSPKKAGWRRKNPK